MEVVPTMTIDKVGRPSKRRRRDSDVPSYDRLKVPAFLTYKYDASYELKSKLKGWLPAMAHTLLETKDWSLLREFSAPVPKPEVKDALDAELVALCVWFLFIDDVPRKMKVGIIRALRNICFGPSKSTNTSTDQESVEKLLVRALNTGNTDVQRQVCLALALLACCCVLDKLTITFGAAIQEKLLKLVWSCDSNSTFHVLNAVTVLGEASKEMRAKIVRTEVSHSWLLKIMSSRQDDKSIMEIACWAVGCIPCGKFSEGLWAHLKDIINVIAMIPFKDYDVRISRGAAFAIFQITKFASPGQIKELVDLDGLKVLFIFLVQEDDVSFTLSFNAIKKILEAGDKDVLRARSGEVRGDGEDKAGDEDVLGEGGGEDIDIDIESDIDIDIESDIDIDIESDGDSDSDSESESEIKSIKGDIEGESKAGDEDVLGEDGDGDGDSDNDGDSENEYEYFSDSDSEIRSFIKSYIKSSKGDIEGMAQLNEYANMIDCYRPGWRSLVHAGCFNNALPSTVRLLKKYRPALLDWWI